MRTSGNKTCSQRSSTTAIGLRVATNSAARTRTATRARNTTPVGHEGTGANRKEHWHVDPDVVSTIGEGDRGHGQRAAGLVGKGVVANVPIAPCLPGGVSPQQQWDEAEVRDGGVGEEQPRRRRSPRVRRGGCPQSEVLPDGDLGGGTSLPGSACEEQRQDDDVVNVGDKE
jgi:hypothetical protein